MVNKTSNLADIYKTKKYNTWSVPETSINVSHSKFGNELLKIDQGVEVEQRW